MNTWIDVTKQLPEKNQSCLVLVQKVVGGMPRNARYITTAKFGSVMMYKEYFNFNGEGIVTHWMPAPGMPEE